MRSLPQQQPLRWRHNAGPVRRINYEEFSTMLLFLNVIYVLIAVAMVALILMQRGAGAQAGSGFGGGASGTVFGSRGASNFLSKSTKWLAIAFFLISLFMAWNATNTAGEANAPGAQDLGVMAPVPSAPAQPAATGTVPSAPSLVPAVPDSTVPVAPPGTDAPAPAKQEAPVQQQPAPATQPAPGG